MKRFTINRALAALLLSLAAMGFSGCGNGNSLTSITVTPVDPVITKTTSTTQTVARQFSATAHFSDGLSVASWSQVTWQSSDPTVLSITNTGAATAYKAGTAVITAIDKAHPTITGSALAIVAELESITIAPPGATISAGTSTQFTATGVYTLTTPSSWSTATTWPQVDITTSVLWSSSDTAVAVISTVTPSNGLATAGTSTGTTTITATDGSSGIFSTATLTVF